ncbi:hypothetical protein ACKI2N_020810 [Cupriavidus sp. 30B13]|uniref:hypothetical protein n=1 Tax=Cupriavidus sp. 30B13 TaxID=3384241 RepID=UPI003B90EC0D
MTNSSPKRAVDVDEHVAASRPTLATNAASVLTPEVVRAYLGSIGKPRLESYRIFFACASDTEVLGAYLWGQAIAGAFIPLVSSYEIVMRNAIHRRASLFSSKGATDSHPWYDYARKDALPTRGKSRDKIAALLCERTGVRKSVQPAPDQVVATLSFGFWPNFLEGLGKREQPRLLTDIFAHHPHSTPKHWGQETRVQQLIGALKSIQDLRNHIAHYEPIWKPHRLTGTETNWARSVRSLRHVHATILGVMGWCCPATPLVYQASYGARLFSTLCTTNAVRLFMQNPFCALQLAPMPLMTPEVAGAPTP